jgi:hypothetical protein
MPERDWDRFGDYLKDLGNAIPPIHDRYILFAGISGGGVMAVLAWLGALSQTPNPTSWFYMIGVVTIAVTLAVACIAWSNHDTEDFLTKKLRKDSELLWQDMNRTHPYNPEDHLHSEPNPTNVNVGLHP